MLLSGIEAVTASGLCMLREGLQLTLGKVKVHTLHQGLVNIEGLFVCMLADDLIVKLQLSLQC